MEYKTFLKEIYNEYNKLQDEHLLFIERLKFFIIGYKNNIINNSDIFKNLNNFLYYMENYNFNNKTLIFNNDEIEDYFNFFDIIVKLPYNNYSQYNINQINQILNNDKFNNLNNQLILINNHNFKLKYCHFIKYIMNSLLDTINYINEQINFNNNIINNMVNFDININQLNINNIIYKNLNKECYNLLYSLYDILKIIFNFI